MTVDHTQAVASLRRAADTIESWFADADAAETEPRGTALARERTETLAVIQDLRDMEAHTEEQIAIVQSIQAEAKARCKEFETERKSATQDILAAKGEVDTWFKGTTSALDLLARACSNILVKADTRQRQAREVALAAIADAGGHVGETLVLPTQAKPVDLPRGVGRDVIKVEVVDAAQVPRGLCSPDPTKIKAEAVAAHKCGRALTIPGVRIWVERSGT